MVMQQAMFIGYSIAEVHKRVIPEKYKGKISPSKSSTIQMQERFSQAFPLPLLDLEQFFLRL